MSILDPGAVAAILDVPAAWTLTGYLCLGYPKSSSDTPLLHEVGWQTDTPTHWEVR